MKIFVKVVSTLTLITIPFLMAFCTTLGERETQPIGSPPVITASFASKEVSHGDNWKIYLEANDPDGDMQRFVYSISRAESGYRSKRLMSIKEPNQARLLGYLSVEISPPQDAQSEWANLTLTLHIRDKGGNTSDKLVFPVALSRKVEQASPAAPFDVDALKDLGRVWYKLRVPSP
jgi:hypothetical protein